MITATRQQVTPAQFAKLSMLGLPIAENEFCHAWEVMPELLDWWIAMDWVLYDAHAVLDGAAAVGKRPHVLFLQDDQERFYVRVVCPSQALLKRRFEVAELERLWELSRMER
jgi:hypothetical protein